jgi:hypothetical protein
MTTCKAVAEFLSEINGRHVLNKPSESDLAMLQQMNLLQILTADQYQELAREVSQLQQAQMAIAQESSQRYQASQAAIIDTRKTHSILFHLEGVDKQHASLEKLQQEQQAVKTIDEDLAKRQQDLAQLMVKKSLLDMACSYDSRYVSITTQGRVALRDLNASLYRVSDTEFPAYWSQSQSIDGYLTGIANQSALFEKGLVQSLREVEATNLWAVSISIAKAGGDIQAHLDKFLSAYSGTSSMSSNQENRLMSAEALSVIDQPIDKTLRLAEATNSDVQQLHVPDQSSLGIASILMMGQRQDGRIPLTEFEMFLPKTPSFEAAALLSLPVLDPNDVINRYASFKNLFTSWGHANSEDTELSSAYLSVSEIPIETVAPKMSIITKGLSGYLQYPLVASAILTSIPVLEANETLNLLEKAYEILGQRTGPISQAEGICLAVRMIHGIDVRALGDLDPTAAMKPTMPGTYYGHYPMHMWVPIVVMHSNYYSTYSGIGGPHPGHVHTWGGGGWGGGYTG